MRLHPQPRPSATPFANLIRIAERGLPFTAADGRAFFRIAAPSSGGFLIFPLRSLSFRNWFFANYFGDYSSFPTNHDFRAVLHHLEAQANADPNHQRLAVWQRVGSRGPSCLPSQLLLDLANPEGQFVEISPGGWKVAAGENALLETYRATGQLPEPLQHSESPAAALEMLRPCLNLESRADWLRCLAWLVSALRPVGPQSFLVLQGPAGSGKTLAARILRSLIDPAAAPFAPLPQNPRQLLALARHHWILAFDQVSTLSPALSDAFCRLATGAGAIVTEVAPADPTRDPLIQHYRRPVLFTVTSRWEPSPEFARRSLTLHLPPFAGGRLQSERSILQRFSEAYPYVIGALCSALATALQRVSNIELSGTVRHPDVLIWALAAAPALGCTESEIEEALAVAPPQPRLVQAIDALVGLGRHWSGTPTALLKLLPPDVCRAANALSRALGRSQPDLAAAGIRVNFHSKHRGQVVIDLDRLAGDDLCKTPAGLSSPQAGPQTEHVENMEPAAA